MDTVLNPVRLENWYRGCLNDSELGHALNVDEKIVRDILHTPTFRSSVQTVRHQGRTIQLLPNKVRVGLSAVHALYQKAGIPLEIASDIIGRTWMISESIGKTLDFISPSVETMILANGDTVAVAALNGNEFDPLMMFDPYSSEEIPISILDEYLDLINGKYVCWSKPKENGYQFLCDLHDVSNFQVGPLDDRQPRAMQFLTVAMRLRGHHERFDTWIGRVDENIFHPQINRRTSKRADMATILQQTDGASSLALVYQTKISVNISLAARSMKRRALGLCVADV